MKNQKKTIAAGVLGVALLAGTAQTFATWQDSATAPIGTIQTGSMSVSVAKGSWSLELDGNQTAKAVKDISKVALVPGNTLVGSFLVTPELVGQDLRAELRFGLAAEGETKLDARYVEAKDAWVVTDGDEDTNITVTFEGLKNEVRPTTKPGTVTVRVNFERNELNGDAKYDSKVTANLGNLEVVLTQVLPTAAN